MPIIQSTDPIDLASAADMALTQMEQADKQYRNDPEWQAALTALREALAAKPTPPRVIVEVSGGVVNHVHSSDPLDVSILDWDNVKGGDDAERAEGDKLDAEATELPYTQ